jgi:phosphoribosyl 1,2-cyclic phosphodiesterase
VLFDAGISRRALYERFAEAQIDPATLDAIVISHEHSDHISGLVSLVRHHQSQTRKPLPVYLNQRTHQALDWRTCQPTVELVAPGDRFPIGDLDIRSFTVPHDAADPMGFVVEAEGHRMGLLTDLGYVPESVKHHLKGCHFLLLESNHDLEMLKVGPYPWSVKQRVMGRNGHLSNDMAAAFVTSGVEWDLHTLVLGHLSDHTNHPAVARLTMENALNQANLHVHLEVAQQTGPIHQFAW